MARYRMAEYIVDIDEIDGKLYYRVIDTETEHVVSNLIELKDGMYFINGEIPQYMFKIVKACLDRYLTKNIFFEIPYEERLPTPFGVIEYKIILRTNETEIKDVRFEYEIRGE